jgi:hypothetical protein
MVQASGERAAFFAVAVLAMSKSAGVVSYETGFAPGLTDFVPSGRKIIPFKEKIIWQL